MYQGVELSKIDPEVKKNSEIQSVFVVVVVLIKETLFQILN